MNREQIIRAWKDEEYRSTLGGAVPENPAGAIEIPDERMDEVGGRTILTLTFDLNICDFGISYALGGTCRNLSIGCCGPDNKA